MLSTTCSLTTFQVGPTYWIESSHHLVLGQSRSLLCPRGIHPVSMIVHLLSLLLATWPAHLCLLSYVPDNIFHTTLFPDPVCPLSVLKGGSYHDSLHHPLGHDQFLKFGIAKWPSLTVICHYWEYTFGIWFSLQFQSKFLSRVMLSSLQNALHPCPFLLCISYTWTWSLVTICPK